MARRYEPKPIDVNLTPMIDVTFLLIIFFMLVSQITQSETDPIHVPRPTDSKAREMEYPHKLIITLVNDGEGGVRRYKVGSRLAKDMDTVRAIAEESNRLAEAEGEHLAVIVRADRDVRYEYVRPVLEAIAKAGLENVNLAAETTSQSRKGLPAQEEF
ncbi:MAG: biopolymer transporter ExbD [Phycisphaerae bacterium]|nr:biopolymer transporter ExbD [Phycisphaerae bacterium]